MTDAARGATACYRLLSYDGSGDGHRHVDGHHKWAMRKNGQRWALAFLPVFVVCRHSRPRRYWRLAPRCNRDGSGDGHSSMRRHNNSATKGDVHVGI